MARLLLQPTASLLSDPFHSSDNFANSDIYDMCVCNSVYIHIHQGWKLAPGPSPVNLCWVGGHFEWASKMSYYFNTEYGIWEQIIGIWRCLALDKNVSFRACIYMYIFLCCHVLEKKFAIQRGAYSCVEGWALWSYRVPGHICLHKTLRRGKAVSRAWGGSKCTSPICKFIYFTLLQLPFKVYGNETTLWGDIYLHCQFNWIL